MEISTDTMDDLPEKAPMDTSSQLKKKEKMFSAEEIPKIVRLFKEADEDGGGGLDIEEFCVMMERLYGTVDKADLIALHMQVDINCDLTVDINELLDFLWYKTTASQKMDFKNQTFPKPITIVPVDHYKAIVDLLFLPYKETSDSIDSCSDVSQRKTKTYQKGQYLSISSDGILNFWSDRFDTPYPIALHKSQNKVPFSHDKKMCVNNMVYLREVQHLAISTSDRELFFYHCNEFPKQFIISHSLIVEDNIVNAMNYWTNGTKAVFSIGDMKGFLYVFISYNVQKNGLFCAKSYEKISLQNYPTVYVSALLKNLSTDFLCVKAPIFNDVCSQIRYFPTLDSFAICGSSSKTMVLATLSKPPRTRVSKKVFESKRDKEFFTCVEYSHSAGHLVTGGTDGILRVWFPHKTMSCELELKGHVKPIIHIMYNPEDKIFVSLSEDKNICVWSEDCWLCRQNFQVQGMGLAPVSSVCYNIHNNELVLANSNIGKYLGRGTDVFQDTLTSHDKPLCCALYHSIFKQAISVCQNGVVTVWDILTGKAVMQFKVTPEHHVGSTAMSFDGAQRRLITVSQDAKVKLWNPNNGSQLDILPITVPKKVSGIVSIENRVFVSGRNSKIIFDLDIDEHDHRFLEHDYLIDVTSMDIHENTLFTASSNGNIVMWDVDTADVLYWLNASKSPRTNMAGKKDQGQTGSLPVEKSQKNFTGTGGRKKPTALPANKTDDISVIVLCLKTRGVNVNTATLLTSTDGYIFAWSVISKGGLLGKFRAVNDERTIITTMSTDANEQILLTGDSTGKIYQWDIQEFGFKQADKGPYEDINGWQVSLCPPPLLGSWQSHLTGVVSVKCDPDCKNVITAGLDSNVRLWTNKGGLIGLFGKDEWEATQLSPEEKPEQEQKRRTCTAETRNSQISFLESPISPPDSPLPNYDNLIDRLVEATATPKITPVLTHEEFFATYRKWIQVRPGFDKLKDLPHQFNEKENNSSQQSPTEVLQGSENTSCPPDTTTTTGCADATKGPNSDTTQLTDNQSQPQITLISGGTDLKQSTPQTASPYLNQTSSKFEGVFKIKDNVLTPCPPDPLPGKQAPEQAPKHVRLLPISEKVWLTHLQPQFKPRPAKTPLATGHTKPTNSSPSKDVQFPPNSDRVQLIHNQSQPQTTLIRGGTPEDVRLPPITDKVWLTQSPAQIPLNTGHSKPMNSMQTSASTVEQRSKTRSKYGCVLKIQQRDTLEDNVLTPCPSNTLPDKSVQATSTSNSAHHGPQ